MTLQAPTPTAVGPDDGSDRPPAPWPARSRWAGITSGVVLAVLGLLLAALLIAPLWYLVRTSLFQGFGFAEVGPNLENYRAALDSTGTVRLIVNTTVFALGVCLVAVTIGGSLAWVGERTNAPFRRWMLLIGLLPLAIPGVVYTLCFILLFGPNVGMVNQVYSSLGFEGNLVNIYSMPGMILVEGAQSSSLAYLLIAGYLRTVDSSLEESARMSGAGIGATLRKITIPLGAPTILGVLLLIFVRAIESFETPALIGIPAGIPVFTSRVFLALREVPPNFGLGATYSVFLIVVTTLCIVAYSRMLRKGERFATVSGKRGTTTRLDLGRFRWLVTAAVVTYSFCVVILPVLVLVYLSILPTFSIPSAETFSLLTLDNYRQAIDRGDFRTAVTNTVLLALGTAVLVSAVSMALAWITVRSKIRGVWVVDALASIPLVIPGIVMGLAFLTLALNIPIPIYGTLVVLLLLHFTRFLPYGMRTATAGLVQIDKELEEAAVMCGATWRRRLVRILVPLVLPTLVGGALYASLLSVRELSGSIMVYSANSRIYSVLLYDYLQGGQFGILAASGVMAVAVLLVVVLILRRTGVLGREASDG